MRIQVILAVGVAVLAAAPVPAQEGTESKPTEEHARPYELMVGDAAPALAIGEWVKGEPVTDFEKGSIYVVEFWATWCGPCIFGMPHLSKLQEKYAERGVTIIGVNIWDDPAKVAPFLKEKAPIHDVPGDEIMRYTVAIEKKDDPRRPQVGVMARTWMQAAGRQGIPCAFVVDGDRRIAWIGHPSGLDDPLDKIVAGTWDIEAAAKEYAARAMVEAEVKRYQQLFAEHRYEKAYALARELVKGPLAGDAGMLNMIAWAIVDPEDTPKTQDLDLALEAAERAVELTKSRDGNILDTLAVVHYQRGDLARAVEIQRLAVERAGEDADPALVGRLRKFEKELRAVDASATGKSKGPQKETGKEKSGR